MKIIFEWNYFLWAYHYSKTNVLVSKLIFQCFKFRVSFPYSKVSQTRWSTIWSPRPRGSHYHLPVGCGDLMLEACPTSAGCVWGIWHIHPSGCSSPSCGCPACPSSRDVPLSLMSICTIVKCLNNQSQCNDTLLLC